MPWNKMENKNKDLQMAECDKCGQWYHRKCAKIPDEIFRRKSCFWGLPYLPSIIPLIGMCFIVKPHLFFTVF
jgi:hypothetical protein